MTSACAKRSKTTNNSGFLYLSIAGFEHTYVSRDLLMEILGYEAPMERVFLEGDTAIIELKDNAEVRDLVENLVCGGG